MSIHTSRNDSTQIIRLETDMVMDSDENAIKSTIEQALKVGIKQFVFSVSIGSIANRAVISRLLRWCKDMIWCDDGKLLFIEKNDSEECVFGELCESLHIPIYQNINTSIVETSKAAKG